ncbi:MAG: peptidylprolyl isomerase [Nanoarchaeota archaeon]|nr:peptidylprolyl isomerase [Nanoarchaeota archaeon]
MDVKKGDKVKVDYTGTFENGKVFDSSTHGNHSHPLEFVVGLGQMIAGFDKAVIGMKKGEEKDITLQPEEAYGQPDPKFHRKVPKKEFPETQKLEVGMMLVIQLQTGQQVPVKVHEIQNDFIIIDMNHPLAGRVLNFKLKIVDIEPSKK